MPQIEQADAKPKRSRRDVPAPVVDETAAIEAVPEIEAAAPEPEVVKPVDDGIAELKRKLDASEAARADAENRAREASRVATAAKSETEDTNLRLVENAIETVKANIGNLKSAYAQSASVGEWDKAAEAQEQMALNSARLLQLENGKQAMAEAAKRPKQPVVNDPVEALASQLTGRSAAWVRSHPEYARDSRLYQKMVAAHNMAVADGHATDSDGYFEAVEDALKINRRAAAAAVPDDDDDPTAEAAQVVRTRASPAAAPVSRNGSAPGAAPRAIRLTPEQAEIASMNKMSPQEYWEQLQRAKRAGEIH